MKSSNKKANMGMAHYLKKFWRANFLAILPVLAVCAPNRNQSNDDPDVSAYH